ncbi:hypothetical protein D917_10336 [Trichinella nativa]|nr:hypothetical protein D917_10336 [Trichinella nativa]
MSFPNLVGNADAAAMTVGSIVKRSRPPSAMSANVSIPSRCHQHLQQALCSPAPTISAPPPTPTPTPPATALASTFAATLAAPPTTPTPSLSALLPMLQSGVCSNSRNSSTPKSPDSNQVDSVSSAEM